MAYFILANLTVLFFVLVLFRTQIKAAIREALNSENSAEDKKLQDIIEQEKERLRQENAEQE